MTDSLPPLVDTTATRLTLHHLAEQVLSAEQVAANGDFRLDATAGRFRHPLVHRARRPDRCASGSPGIDLLRETDHGTTRVPIDGDIDIHAAAVLYAWWDLGTRTLTAIAATYGARSSDVVLYPEHFDVGSTLDLEAGKLNLGFSPGDDFCAAPYVYAGPWEKRTGEFWNAPFGAYRRYDEIDQARTRGVGAARFSTRR